MKRIKLVLLLMLVFVLVFSVSCAKTNKQSQGEDTPKPARTLDEYKTLLTDLYNELEDKVKENPSKEDWEAFSKDWMPRLTQSKSNEVDENSWDEDKDKIAKLDYGKNQLMYLWTEYNDGITEGEFDQERIDQLKKDIEECLK